ncbi:MAG: DnaJ domain-containing protein [Calothrix sp. MO_167.B12]|nr:DnaJ domain-containing protein [Calothrix sp. MO_167.B12]
MLWELAQFQLSAITTVVITPNGKTLVSASKDGTIKLWNFHTGELISTFTGHSAAVESIAVSPNGQIIASSSSDGIIKLWNLDNGEILHSLSGCSPIAFSPNGKKLLSGGRRGRIKIWQQMQGIDEPRNDLVLSDKWWEVLGVDAHTSPHHVKNVYRRLARQYHPDINNTASAQATMQAINRAYQEFRSSKPIVDKKHG